jgi:hypothetical protein
MPEITGTAERARAVKGSLVPVLVRAPNGAVLGSLGPIWTAEDIAEAKRALASDEPQYATARVLEHLRSLESQETP